MKALKATLVIAAALLAVGASTGAFARHHGGVRFGVFVGAPAFAYGYYGPYYRPYYPPYYDPYYYPAVVPAAPPVYVEQGQPGPAASAPPPPSQSSPSQSSYWYFCRESNSYYPYVNECAGPWQRVSPQPPS